MIPLTSTRPALSNPSIPNRFFGLISAVAEHLLALFSLASIEAQELLKKTIYSLVLLIATIAIVLITYLGLLATISTIAVTQFHWSWGTVLGIITLFHFVIALILITLLRQQCSGGLPFEKTTLEIQHDLEALASTSSSNANNF